MKLDIEQANLAGPELVSLVEVGIVLIGGMVDWTPSSTTLGIMAMKQNVRRMTRVRAPGRVNCQFMVKLRGSQSVATRLCKASSGLIRTGARYYSRSFIG
jgi:hypothetical protein